MRILNPQQIVYALLQGRITVTPLLAPEQIGPTIDLRLGTDFLIKKMDRLTHFDAVDFNCSGS